MSNALERSVDAATRVLNAHASGAPLSSTRAELAAWLVGTSGAVPPRHADPTSDLEIRLAALLGARDYAAAEAFLLKHVPTKPGERLLFSACMLAGHQMADVLVELANRLKTGWFLGSMLTRTTQPSLLLSLVHSDPRHHMRTLCELVIAGRDEGVPIAEAEALWAEIAREPHWNRSYMQEYCDGAVRIKAREDLEQANDLLETFERPEQPGHVFEGAFALLARLVRQDPARAAAFAADAIAPQDRAIRLQGLTWWFQFPQPAESLVDELLTVREPYVQLSLVRILAPCEVPQCFERALAGAEGQSPIEIADRMALGVHALRVAGRHEDAERVREQLMPWLVVQRVAPGQIAPLDFFEVISAPGRPTLTAWRTPLSLPHECP